MKSAHLRPLLKYGSILVAFSAAILLIGSLLIFRDLPELDSLASHLAVPSIRITDRHGRLLYEVIPVEGGRHANLDLASIPIVLQQATIATEDRTFFQNPGVDARGILRAFWINLRGGETLAGGSTITQQVARNLLLEQEERIQRTVLRKLRESLLAWRLARRLPKGEILALYLNQIYYGGLAYGVEAAAQTYFGKSIAELDLAECALLAGLPQAPALYNPLVDPEAAKQRQLVVLDLMEKEGMISAAQRSLATREPLVFTSTPYPFEAPHFVLMVRAQLDALLPADVLLTGGGFAVRTTLDLDWQHQAERAIARQLELLRNPGQGQLGHNVNSAALVALDPASGEIRALVGSPDYFDAQHGGAINMAISPRQPGSALKPLVYAAGFDPTRSQPWTPATLIYDVRTTFVTRKGEPYVPANYDGLEHGPVLVREALASSLNIPAVVATEQIGLEEIIAFATDLGITTLADPDRYDLSLALGGGEVRLLELTAAYAAFANGGFRVAPYTILQITDLQGNALYQPSPPKLVQVLDRRVAWLISDILSDNDARAPAFGQNSVLRLDRPAAVKTGTTTNFHDNWTVGYTPDLVAGVWVGNTSHEPMRDVTGVTGAGPIWHQFMRAVHTGMSERVFTRPPGLTQVEICSLSGKLPTEDCPYRWNEWFIIGTEPTERDPFYRSVIVDLVNGTLAHAGVPPEQQSQRLVLNLPPQVHPWARTQGLLLYDDLVRGTQLQQGEFQQDDSLLQMVAPGDQTVYRLAPELSREMQRIHLQAVASAGLHSITLWLDGMKLAGFSSPPYEAWWALEVGTHQAWAAAISQEGEQVVSETVTFEVQAPP
jgi:penicillin-binding protein 1C